MFADFFLNVAQLLISPVGHTLSPRNHQIAITPWTFIVHKNQLAILKQPPQQFYLDLKVGSGKVK
jgi:hypothetical protein